MILKAKHHFFIYPFFKRYTVWLVKRKFKILDIIGELERKTLPILLISNHVSWWDGFWAMYVNLKVFNKKFHFMMLEEQLRKYWFFNYTGGFSVNKQSKSVLETLSYTSELLNNNKNLVLIFPQGEIQSIYNQDFHFERGIECLLKNHENTLQIVFMANLTDYFSYPKPGVYSYIKEYNESFALESIQKNYNQFYQTCVEQQKQIGTEQ